MSKEITPQSNNSEEVDLGQLFKLIGRAFNKLYSFIGFLFKKLFLTFIWFVFFIKKHLIKIAIAGIIGIALGFFIEKTSEPAYKSYCIVKQNYNTGETLYNSINYFNGLVGQKDTITLENTLGIRSNDASSILSFSLKSVATNNEMLRSYDTYIKTIDSVIALDISFKDFIENDKDYNHPYQQIAIKSRNKTNFNIVFNKIIETINTNDYFKREQEKNIIQLSNRKLAIENSLIKSDSLQNTYKRVLEKSIENVKGSEIGITFEGANDIEKTKEYNLYLNDIKLREDLVGIERAISDNENIIEIMSSKQDNGLLDNNIEFLNKSVSPKLLYGFLFALITFLILLGFQFIKYLERYKDQLK